MSNSSRNNGGVTQTKTTKIRIVVRFVMIRAVTTATTTPY